MLLLLALLVGIVTMHAVDVSLDHAPVHSTLTGVEHHAMGRHAEPADAPCEGDGCGQQHTGLHACVFIMTALSVLAGLALLCWVGLSRMMLIAPQLRHRCRRRQRAPPWTVLSLHELSILRV
jgi:Family of unknown function (DUF6153)